MTIPLSPDPIPYPHVIPTCILFTVDVELAPSEFAVTVDACRVALDPMYTTSPLVVSVLVYVSLCLCRRI